MNIYYVFIVLAAILALAAGHTTEKRQAERHEAPRGACITCISFLIDFYMMHIRDIIHIFYAIVGIPANFVLLYTIIQMRSSSQLKSYALILFNIAIFDIIEIALEVFGEPRLIVDSSGGNLIFIFHGYCSMYGAEVCYVLLTMGVHLGFFNFFLTAYSFWFRYTVLSKPPPSGLASQLVILALLAPNVVLMVCCFFTTNSHQQTSFFLESQYPDMDMNRTIHRSLSIYDPHSIPSVIWSPNVPVITYTAVIVIRGKIIRRLASLAENMSQQTNIVHQSLIRALTVHAMLPLTICIGISSFYLQLLGVRGEFIDSMLFTFACIPSVCNPMLTLFFVMPYRRFIHTAFGRGPKTSIQFVPVVRRSSVHA